MIRRLGSWLRGGWYRFVILVVLLMMVQTVVLTFLGGWAAVVAGGMTILALAILAGAYASGTGVSR
ncbi:hypothetical protein [Rubrobacter aplysinae]|uniref:hypothetical protein n=1 Tax=Rubrobacter aplysinae TaxID=909625 RepID=UPI00064C456C|nr:hypothetical protein [Rubrobacter aplysinae]